MSAEGLTTKEWHEVWNAAGNGVGRLGHAAEVVDRILAERAAGDRATVAAYRTALLAANDRIIELMTECDGVRGGVVALLPHEESQDISLMDAWSIFADIRAVLDGAA